MPGRRRRRALRRCGRLRDRRRSGAARPLRRRARERGVARRPEAAHRARHAETRRRRRGALHPLEVGGSRARGRLERPPARYGRIHPQPSAPTDAESAELEKLRTRHDELAILDEHEWTDELIAEGEANRSAPRSDRACRRRAGHVPRGGFSDGPGASPPSVATATLQVIQGLVKPEDMPKEPAGRWRHERPGCGHRRRHDRFPQPRRRPRDDDAHRIAAGPARPRPAPTPVSASGSPTISAPSAPHW